MIIVLEHSVFLLCTFYRYFSN